MYRDGLSKRTVTRQVDTILKVFGFTGLYEDSGALDSSLAPNHVNCEL